MDNILKAMQDAALVAAAREKAKGLRVYDRESVRDAKGYDALVASRIFDANVDFQLVIVSTLAITSRGFRIADRRTPVVYYRKASKGRFGRSVQQRCVTLD